MLVLILLMAIGFGLIALEKNDMNEKTIQIDENIQQVPVQFYITAWDEIVGAVWLGDAFGALYADVVDHGDGTLEIGKLRHFYQPDNR